MSLELVRTLPTPSPDLAAEANHRIANHLAMMAGLLRARGARIHQSRATMTAQEVRSLLEDFGARLDTVAKVHRLLSHGDGAEPIELDPYLGSIAERLVSSLAAAGKITLRREFRAGCALPPEKAITLGLLVGELVTNAVKYAHPAGVAGTISVATSTTRDGFIVVDVSDDGVGLPEGFDPLGGGGMGLRIIQTLAAQLGGTISFENHGLGLSCSLSMPHARVELRAVT